MFNSVITPLLAFLLLYKYVGLFLVMFSASIALPLPTNSLLLAAGTFASQGYFNFAMSLTAAAGGNIMGDCVDYLLARHYGRRALRLLRVRTPSYLERLERYVRDHPGPTIFLTRFVGTAEPLGSLLAGFSGVSFSTFLGYDILGNVVSDGAILYAGYVFGAHWEAIANLLSVAGWVIFCFLVIAAIIITLWYRGRRSRNKKTRP